MSCEKHIPRLALAASSARWSCAVLVAGLWLASFGAAALQAQEPPPRRAGFDTPRLLALGSGMRAGATSTSALAANPAALARGSLYHFEGVSAYDPARNTLALQAGAVDSVTSKVAAGFGARGYLNTSGEGFRGSDIRLGLGMPIGNALSFGVTGRYVRFGYDGTTEAANPFERELARGPTLDTGLQWHVAKGLDVALLGYNLISLGSPYAPTMFGGSASYGVAERFLVGGDVLMDVTSFDRPKLVAGGGLEYVVGGAMPLRVGYRHDQGYGLHSLTAGVGYLASQVGIDLALRQDLGQWRGTSLMASFRYAVQ